MRSAQFFNIALSDSEIAAILEKAPVEEVMSDVDKFSQKTTVKALLLIAGERILQILIDILAAYLRNKYILINTI